MNDAPRGVASTARRVILAEDDGALRAQLSEDLRSAGYQVVEVSDGAELLRSLAFESTGKSWCATFDAVVMDVRLPGVVGTSALEGLAWLGIAGRAVLISAFADEELVQWGTLVGAAAVLRKPLDLDELLTAVERAVADDSVASIPDHNDALGLTPKGDK